MQGKILNNNLILLLMRLNQNEKIRELLCPDGTTEELIHKHILATPAVPMDKKGNYIVVAFMGGQNAENNAFNYTTIRVDIICHLDTWITANKNVRVFMLMEEVLDTLKEVRLEGIGAISFNNWQIITTLNADYGGYSLSYTNVEFDDID